MVLLSHDAEARRISFRHYSISTAPSGVTKGVKALVAGKGLPNMSGLQDVSELLTRSGYGSVRSLCTALMTHHNVSARDAACSGLWR